MKNQKPILLVEDDTIDAMTVKRALNEIKVSNTLIIVQNGEQALNYLEDPQNEPPCIILTDLNMPRMNGMELIERLKGSPRLRRIPVIVLTTSTQEQDRLHSFSLSVAGYIIKPVDYLQFVEAVRTIDVYWTLSELPD